MQEFKLRRMGLIIAFAIVAFHPTFIILSGSVNNDILSLTFMFGAILNTIVWYREQTLKNIMKIAFMRWLRNVYKTLCMDGCSCHCDCFSYCINQK